MGANVQEHQFIPELETPGRGAEGLAADFLRAHYNALVPAPVYQ